MKENDVLFELELELLLLLGALIFELIYYYNLYLFDVRELHRDFYY